METNQLSACEVVLQRILEVNRVQGYVIIDGNGLRANEKIENTTALQYAHLYGEIANVAQSLVRDLDPTSELVYFRIQTKHNEVLASITDDEITMVVQKTVSNIFG